MKKKILFSLAILVVALVSVCLVSCGDDDSSISGLYYYTSGGGSRTAYNFINSNTVEIYGAMTSNPNETWHGEHGVSFPLRSGWYYWPNNKSTHSYTIVEDKIIIGLDRILTISGNTLIYDDLNVILYKWD